jgi:hypothetical protein
LTSGFHFGLTSTLVTAVLYVLLYICRDLYGAMLLLYTLLPIGESLLICLLDTRHETILEWC